MPTYCGNKATPPGKTKGTPNECLKKGFGAGLAQGKKANRKAFARGANVVAQATKRKAFKNINKVQVDELREIAVKLQVATRAQMKKKGGGKKEVILPLVRKALILKGVPPQGNLSFPYSRKL
tara:strand:- start:1709 stop:2077 length:369 start_codon:yes stop_codon:yes gene_type:complete